MRLLLTLSTAFLIAPTFAHADPVLLSPAAPAMPPAATDVHQMHGDDCAQARRQHKPCVIDMGKGDELTADAPIATGTSVGLIEMGRHGSLIRIRRDFITEILKSAEDL